MGHLNFPLRSTIYYNYVFILIIICFHCFKQTHFHLSSQLLKVGSEPTPCSLQCRSDSFLFVTKRSQIIFPWVNFVCFVISLLYYSLKISIVLLLMCYLTSFVQLKWNYKTKTMLIFSLHYFQWNHSYSQSHIFLLCSNTLASSFQIICDSVLFLVKRSRL